MCCLHIVHNLDPHILNEMVQEQQNGHSLKQYIRLDVWNNMNYHVPFFISLQGIYFSSGISPHASSVSTISIYSSVSLSFDSATIPSL